MKKNIKFRYLLVLIAVSVFLFIFPWTKEVEIFRAEDINWEILKSAVKTNTFDVNTLSFYPTYQLSKEIQKLNGKEINIKGFFKKEKHENKTDYILTETVTEVCFACDHDEHYNLLQIVPQSNEIRIFDTLQNDKLINVTGKFQINEQAHTQYVFLLTDAHLKNN